MKLHESLVQQASYTAWANARMLDNARRVPASVVEEPCAALFGDVRGTFDHIAVIAELFEAHVEGRPAPHRARTRSERLPFEEVARRLEEVDERWRARVRSWSERLLGETVEFRFVDGGLGRMTRAAIVLHLAHHAAYHRGFVSTLLFPMGASMLPTDYTVFIRDVWR